MPIVTIENLLREMTDKVFPGSVALPASIFNSKSLNSFGHGRVASLFNKNNMRIIMCGVTHVGDSHVCGR